MKWFTENKLISFGALVTIAYGVAVWVLLGQKLGDYESLSLNETGDFLAGVFGPLTLFWLILGYIQQGQELKQNSQALHLQAEELKNSVAQQKELVQAAFQQLDLEREKLKADHAALKQANNPRFSFEGGASSRNDIEGATYWAYELKNYGRDCQQVLVDLTHTNELELHGNVGTPHLGPQGAMGMAFRMKDPARDTSAPGTLLVRCINALGEQIVATYSVEVSEGRLLINPTS
ncbi:hypothetical protein [Caenimonas soli]|uniref:hypothetical protein n=1 Tax=Caenimonas soli TaxID=2735555 RepID=UPI001557174D|nr:hypothetical protein [Caenimonas soli]NPC57844.1 hypothetical protein [Caenimonas soli]